MEFRLFRQNKSYFPRIISNDRPYAKTSIKGDSKHSRLHGAVYLYSAYEGTLVVAEIYGLPEKDESGKPLPGFYGFHVHEGAQCTGDASNPFKNAGGHYNPQVKPHPEHAGDFPPLLSNGGYAYMTVYTERFKPEQVVGHTFIVHQMSDDFHTQPSGNSGPMIGCGQIVRYQ